MVKLTSKTGKADVQVSPDGASVIFSNKAGLQIYWPASDWAAVPQFVRRELDRITNPANRPPVSDEQVDAEAEAALERMRLNHRLKNG